MIVVPGVNEEFDSSFQPIQHDRVILNLLLFLLLDLGSRQHIPAVISVKGRETAALGVCHLGCGLATREALDDVVSLEILKGVGHLDS